MSSMVVSETEPGFNVVASVMRQTAPLLPFWEQYYVFGVKTRVLQTDALRNNQVQSIYHQQKKLLTTKNDVASTDELAVDIYLRDRRPLTVHKAVTNQLYFSDILE